MGKGRIHLFIASAFAACVPGPEKFHPSQPSGQTETLRVIQPSTSFELPVAPAPESIQKGSLLFQSKPEDHPQRLPWSDLSKWPKTLGYPLVGGESSDAFQTYAQYLRRKYPRLPDAEIQQEIKRLKKHAAGDGSKIKIAAARSLVDFFGEGVERITEERRKEDRNYEY